MNRVEENHERVVPTRNGRPAAVILSPDDPEALEETLDLLSDPEAMRAIRVAEADLAAGRFITERGPAPDVPDAMAVWQLRPAAAARRSPAALPPKVAAAVVEFILGPLLAAPRG